MHGWLLCGAEPCGAVAARGVLPARTEDKAGFVLELQEGMCVRLPFSRARVIRMVDGMLSMQAGDRDMDLAVQEVSPARIGWPAFTFAREGAQVWTAVRDGIRLFWAKHGRLRLADVLLVSERADERLAVQITVRPGGTSGLNDLLAGVHRCSSRK